MEEEVRLILSRSAALLHNCLRFRNGLAAFPWHTNRAAAFGVVDHMGIQVEHALKVGGGKDLAGCAAGNDTAIAHHY